MWQYFGKTQDSYSMFISMLALVLPVHRRASVGFVHISIVSCFYGTYYN